MDQSVLPDVYEVLGLDREDTTPDLLAEVSFLRAHWAPRVDKPGVTGDTARTCMRAIETAEQAFSSEEARARYQDRLAGESELELEMETGLGFDSTVDYYDLLSLERGDSAAGISSALASMKANWLRRSTRGGAVGEEAQRMVDQIESAERAFESDVTRGRYDRHLAEIAQGAVEQEHLRPAGLAEMLVQEAQAKQGGPARSAAEPNSADAEASIREGNLYQNLGLDPSTPTELIRAQLRDELKPSWQIRASKAGQVGQKARQKLTEIAIAEKVFASEEAREEYDRQIRERPGGESADNPVDWLQMAWSFYFKNDWGAASVAARKAREQDPEGALGYVVSAWVELARGETRRAKDYADEAFVLDELGEDIVDVHYLRGAVFYSLFDYDRAIESFARALSKATDLEAPEIWMKKAWAEERKRNIPGMIASCVRALSIPVDLKKDVWKGLMDTTYRAITLKCSSTPATESLRLYNDTRTGLNSSAVQEPAKSSLLHFIDGRLEVLRKLDELEKYAWSLSTVSKPDGTQKDWPLVPAGAGVVSLLFTELHGLFGFVGLVLLAWALYTIVLRSTWFDQMEKYQQAQRELQQVRGQISMLQENSRALKDAESCLPRS